MDTHLFILYLLDSLTQDDDLNHSMILCFVLFQKIPKHRNIKIITEKNHVIKRGNSYWDLVESTENKEN